MAALNFPGSPVLNQIYPDPPVAGVPQYRWNGFAWVNEAQDSLQFVKRIGDTMTGSLVIDTSTDAYLHLKKFGSTRYNSVVGYTGDATRWQVQLGNSDPETGFNNGSNFSIDCFNDAGAYVGSPLTINRATAVSKFAASVVVDGGTPKPAAPSTTHSVLAGHLSAGAGAIGLNAYLYQDSGSWRIWNAGFGGAYYFDITTGQHRWFTSSASGVPGATPAMNLMGSIDATGNLKSSGGHYISTQYAGETFLLYSTTDGQNRYVTLQAGYAVYSIPGQLHLMWEGGYDCMMHGSTGTFQLNVPGAYKPGGGAWIDNSDARIKNVEAPYTRGLSAVTALNPVIFTFKGNDTMDPLGTRKQQVLPGQSADKNTEPYNVVPYPESMHYHAARDGKKFAGLIAQDVEGVFPELITKRSGYINGVEVSDIRDIDTSPLIFALVNAVKELAARVEQLEFENGT